MTIRRRQVFWVTVTNTAFAVGRLRVSPTTTRQCLPSLLFNAVSEPLEIQAMMDVSFGKDADHPVNGSRKFVSVPLDEPSHDVVGEPRMCDCGV